jgi:hypothetical protein
VVAIEEHEGAGSEESSRHVDDAGLETSTATAAMSPITPAVTSSSSGRMRRFSATATSWRRRPSVIRRLTAV